MINQEDQLQEQLSSQSGIQDIDEQQLEAVTGGGFFSSIKGVFSSSKTSKNDPTKNPYYDPKWRPVPAVNRNLDPKDTSRVSPDLRVMGNIPEGRPIG